MTKHTILFLAANPVGTDRLTLDKEARAIQVELKRSGLHDQFDLVTRWAAEPLDLLRELRKLRPTVVHFMGHGRRPQAAPSIDGDGNRFLGHRPSSTSDELAGAMNREPGGLYFQAADGQPQLASAAAIALAFGAAGSSVRVVVFNACYSDAQAEALLAHVDCVVGMSGAICDDAARHFAVGFYGGLGAREPVAAAYRQGKAATSLEGLRDGELPQLRVRNGVDADHLFLYDPVSGDPKARSTIWHQANADRSLPGGLILYRRYRRSAPRSRRRRGMLATPLEVLTAPIIGVLGLVRGTRDLLAERAERRLLEEPEALSHAARGAGPPWATAYRPSWILPRRQSSIHVYVVVPEAQAAADRHAHAALDAADNPAAGSHPIPLVRVPEAGELLVVGVELADFRVGRVDPIAWRPPYIRFVVPIRPDAGVALGVHRPRVTVRCAQSSCEVLATFDFDLDVRARSRRAARARAALVGGSAATALAVCAATAQHSLPPALGWPTAAICVAGGVGAAWPARITMVPAETRDRTALLSSGSAFPQRSESTSCNVDGRLITRLEDALGPAHVDLQLKLPAIDRALEAVWAEAAEPRINVHRVVALAESRGRLRDLLRTMRDRIQTTMFDQLVREIEQQLDENDRSADRHV